MLREELSAIISIAVIAIVFFAALMQDMRRIRDHLAHRGQSPAKNEERFFSSDKTPSKDVGRRPQSASAFSNERI